MDTLQQRTWVWGLRIFGAAVLLFLVVPQVAIIPLSFNSESLFTFPMPGFSLRWYQDLFYSEEWRRAFFNSVIIATLTALLSTALGAAAALGLARLRWRAKAALTGLLLSPIIVPSVIAAVAIYFTFTSVGLAQSMPGLVLAHVAISSPFVVIIISSGLSSLNPNYGRAAISLGASPWHAFWTITLPLIMPSAISASLFAFVASFDEVIIILFLANIDQYTLPVQMWRGVRQEISPTVLAASCFMIVLQVAAMGAVEFARRRSKRRLANVPELSAT